MITAIIIGIFSILLNSLFFNLTELTIAQYFAIPLVSIILTLFVSIPCSTGLNYFAFKRGLNPNNVINPVMTAIDDFFTVFFFFLTLLMLGVP
jgi:cation transporter-like permease